ncbi:HIT domain-containing protein [Bacteroidota bacterium]
MEVLWASWRSKYIQGFKDEKTDPNNNPCFICEAGDSKERDKELFVVARRERCFVMLNKFPYNGGHVLVAPYRHVGEIDELSDDELTEMMQTVRETTKVLTSISNPHGYNIGINIGRVSGAGLPGHIHIHIVPRWHGDTSFMSVTADTKVVSQSLEETQAVLSEAFENLDK